ncbi:MAG: SufS family cysteine desulfurase [Candidatus Calescibacterium sp.]|nr:SufS family cysteine desulfurase [Candidatus Calescibacterium sp.]MCX7733295.1 SufS family cysteine desulfurase [bacterium]MDW8086783.1 SufS family cysteine desulfurase [Candidatus Calescibacterium sp.]
MTKTDKIVEKNYDVRKDFPSLQRKINGYNIVYFDSAATSLKPQVVIDAENEYNTLYPANIHRAVHTMSHEATEKYIDAHKKVAQYINAKSWREVIFTKNATEGANLLAYSLGLHRIYEGDKIIITIMEHHANLVPWQFIAKYRKAQLIYADINEDGSLKEEELIDKVDKKTKIVSISGASNVTGYMPNLKRIIKAVKEKNPETLVIVDAAQLLPHVRLDVRNLGCDFIFASGHKMLGPSGTGFVWGKEQILEEIEPFMYGGDMISRVTLEGAQWNELPYKFEGGTPNIAGGIGLGKAVEYLSEHQNIEHEKELYTYAMEQIKNIKNIKLCVEPKDYENYLGIISFNVEGVHPHDISDFLNRYGIAVRSGHHCAQPLMTRLKIENSVRVSFYIYNTKEEVDFFIDVLKKAVNIFT